MIEHQLTALSDVGMIERGNALPERIKDLQAHVSFGTHTVSDPMIAPGEGTARICLSTESTDGTRNYRQFRLELIDYREDLREVQVHLYVSQLADRAGVPAGRTWISRASGKWTRTSWSGCSTSR